MKDNGTGNGSGFLSNGEPNRPLLGAGQPQQNMLMSIGHRLREIYVVEPSDTLPDTLRGLLDRLAAETGGNGAQGIGGR